MPEITRVNGGAQPGSWYGLTPKYLKIDTGNVTYETSDSADANYYLKPLSTFDKAVFAINTEASIVSLNKPADGGNVFLVQVDNTCSVVTGNDTVATNTMANNIKSALNANLVTITVYGGFEGTSLTTTL